MRLGSYNVLVAELLKSSHSALYVLHVHGATPKAEQSLKSWVGHV